MLARFIAILGAVWLAGASAQAQLNEDESMAAVRSPIVVAHRSVLMGGFPENSLAGIEHRIERGIGMVHINLQLTSDSQYVLMHDSTLNRTTDVERVFPGGPPGGPTRRERGGKDYVRDYTLAELRQLELTGGADGGAHAVPTLEEALDLVAGRVPVLMGLSIYEVGSLAARLEAYDPGNLLLFDLFYGDHRFLQDIVAATGIAGAASLTQSREPVADLVRLAESTGRLELVVMLSRQATPDFIDRAEALGVRYAINGWRGGEDSALAFHDDPGPWMAAVDAGAAILMTQHPEALLDLLSK